MATSELRIVINGKDNASGALKGFGNVLGSIQKIAAGIISAQVITKVADTLFQVGSKAIASTGNIQALQVGIESLVARELKAVDSTLSMRDALGAAGPKAKDLMEQLSKVAILSPFEKNVVDATFKSAMAFGFATDEAVKFTKATLDVAAGVGADNEMLGRMGYNLAQIRMQNKVTAMDIRQLAMAGFDLVSVLRYVGDEIGVNIKDHNDFNKALESGEVSWQQFTELYAKYADENFGGASERMARTLMGLKSTLSDVFELTMPQILQPAVEKFTDFANTILDRFLKIRDSGDLEEMGVKLGDAIGKILDPLGRVVTFFDAMKDPKLFRAGGDNVRNALVYAFGSEQGARLADFADKLRASKDKAIETFAPIIDAARNLGSAFIESIPLLQTYAADMGSFLAGLGEAGGAGIISNIASTINSIADVWREHGDTILSVVNFVWRVVTTTIAGAVTLVTGIVAGLANYISGAFDIIKAVFTGDWQGALDALVSTASTGLSILLNTVTTFMQMVLSIVGTDLTQFRTVIVNNLNALWLIITTIIANVAAGIKEKLVAFYEAGVALVQRLIDGAASLFGSAVSFIGALPGLVVGAIRAKLNDLYAAGAELVKNVRAGAMSLFGNVKTTIGGFVLDVARNGVLGKIGEFFSAGAELINNIAAGAAGSFRAAIDSVMGWVHTLISEIKAAFAGFRITIPVGLGGGGVSSSGGGSVSSAGKGSMTVAQQRAATKLARGGKFIVDGEPGVDRVPVMFWGTRGEEVTVGSVGASKLSNSGNVFHIYEARNAKETAAEIAKILRMQGAAI